MAYFDIGAAREGTHWASVMPTFTGDITVSQALTMGNMNFEYQMHPAFGRYDTEDGSHYHPLTNTRVMVREPISQDPRPLALGFRGNRYTPLQHESIGRILDPLTEDWRVDAVGVLSDYRISFVMLNMGDFYVGDQHHEKHTTHLILSDDKRGPGSAFLGILTKRWYCLNQYAHALTSIETRIPHTRDIEAELQFRRDLEIVAVNKRLAALKAYNRMITTRISMEEARDIINSAFPYVKPPRSVKLAELAPEEASSEAIDRVRTGGKEGEEWMQTRNEFVDRQRAEAVDQWNIFNANNDLYYAHGSAYAAFQAVTAQTNHSDMYRGSQAQQLTREIFGDHARVANRAYHRAMELVTVSA